jgi:multiple sugar transport system ATP-binding protein
MLHFARGGLQLPIAAFAATEGQEITLGLRPEDCALSDSGQPAGVSLVSPLGSETHVTVNMGGVELVVRLPKDVSVHPGDALRLAADPRRIHVFDTASGLALERVGG